MGYTIPDAVNAAYLDQAEPDAGDFLVLGDHRTGVVSGGAITALALPNMAISFAKCVDVINDTLVPYDGAASLAIQPADSAPRFDLVGLTANPTTPPLIIRGQASLNPVFPTFDPTTFCWHAAVYVRGGTLSIQASDIISKETMLSQSFQRSYVDGNQTFIAASDSLSITSKKFRVSSSGTISWVSSALSRVADAATQFLTSLTVQSVDEINSPTPLIVKAGSTIAAATQRLVSFVTNGGVEKAYVNGAGQGYFDNFKALGLGPPNGNVVGTVGDLYVDRGAPRNLAVWIKETGTSNTGWISFRSYVIGSLELETFVNPQGQATFDNFKRGYGQPNGSIVGLVGDLYVDRLAPQNAAVWIKQSGASTTMGWVSLLSYIATPVQQIPVGTYFEWAGRVDDPIPTGFALANGQMQSTVDPTFVPLFNLIQYRYGGGGGTFQLPDMRGVIGLGSGGSVLSVPVGVRAGAADGLQTLSEGSMPKHTHILHDNGHIHQKYGLPWTFSSTPTWNALVNALAHPQPPGTNYANVWPIDYPDSQGAGVWADYTGGGAAFSILGPVQGVTYLLKL